MKRNRLQGTNTETRHADKKFKDLLFFAQEGIVGGVKDLKIVLVWELETWFLTFVRTWKIIFLDWGGEVRTRSLVKWGERQQWRVGRQGSTRVVWPSELRRSKSSKTLNTRESKQSRSKRSQGRNMIWGNTSESHELRKCGSAQCSSQEPTA